MYDGAGSAIIGVSDYVPAKGEHVEYWWLQAQLARQAVADAGLSRDDIDGVVFTRSGYWQSKPVFPSTFCEHVGITPAWMEIAPHGGAAMASAIWRAAGAIRTGLAQVVLVMSADNRQTRLQRSGVVSRIADQNMDPEFETPHGPLFASNFALMAHRYMHEHSVTHEAFAQVAVSNRRWASLHPAARMRAPLTVDDVLSSRPITSPLNLLDICLVTDGGAAVVLVGADRAADAPRPPVHLLGFGDAAESQTVTGLSDLVRPALYRRAAGQAFLMAGIGPADVDVAYPYDPSTSFALWGMEEMGFAEPGGGAELFASGAAAPGGRLPVNTHGGLLSYAHPGVPGAMLAVVEAVRQLRGEAGERQVPGAKVAAASSMGGFMAITVNLFGTGDAVQRPAPATSVNQ
jgi:acetyl-CoA acetyltransferase